MSLSQKMLSFDQYSLITLKIVSQIIPFSNRHEHHLDHIQHLVNQAYMGSQYYFYTAENGQNAMSLVWVGVCQSLF